MKAITLLLAAFMMSFTPALAEPGDGHDPGSNYSGGYDGPDRGDYYGYRPVPPPNISALDMVAVANYALATLKNSSEIALTNEIERIVKVRDYRSQKRYLIGYKRINDEGRDTRIFQCWRYVLVSPNQQVSHFRTRCKDISPQFNEGGNGGFDGP